MGAKDNYFCRDINVGCVKTLTIKWQGGSELAKTIRHMHLRDVAGFTQGYPGMDCGRFQESVLVKYSNKSMSRSLKGRSTMILGDLN